MAAPHGSTEIQWARPSREKLLFKPVKNAGGRSRPHPQIQQLVTVSELPGVPGLGKGTGHPACWVLGRLDTFWKVDKQGKLG